jgi:hypothetical protein
MQPGDEVSGRWAAVGGGAMALGCGWYAWKLAPDPVAFVWGAVAVVLAVVTAVVLRWPPTGGVD